MSLVLCPFLGKYLWFHILSGGCPEGGYVQRRGVRVCPGAGVGMSRGGWVDLVSMFRGGMHSSPDMEPGIPHVMIGKRAVRISLECFPVKNQF